MRVTSGMVSSQIGLDLQRALDALSRQQTRVASGRRIVDPQDDPGGAAQSFTVRSRQAANAQFRKNVAEARTTLEAVDTSLRGIVETVTRARELAVQGGNDSNDAVARRSLATSVDQLLEDLVASANGRGPAGMLYGGQESTVAPYTATRDAEGHIIAVTPNARGLDADVQAEVSEGLTMRLSMSGTTVFGAATDTAYAFDVLIRLRDALAANDGATVRASLGDLDTLMDRVTLASTTAGTRLGWLATLGNHLEDEDVALAGSLSRLEDLDMARAIETLMQMETAYQSGLASGARIMHQSLLDFLR